MFSNVLTIEVDSCNSILYLQGVIVKRVISVDKGKVNYVPTSTCLMGGDFVDCLCLKKVLLRGSISSVLSEQLISCTATNNSIAFR